MVLFKDFKQLVPLLWINSESPIQKCGSTGLYEEDNNTLSFPPSLAAVFRLSSVVRTPPNSTHERVRGTRKKARRLLNEQSLNRYFSEFVLENSEDVGGKDVTF